MTLKKALTFGYPIRRKVWHEGEYIRESGMGVLVIHPTPTGEKEEMAGMTARDIKATDLILNIAGIDPLTERTRK